MEKDGLEFVFWTHIQCREDLFWCDKACSICTGLGTVVSLHTMMT